MPESRSHILIVGAGLCGSLLALRMAQRGHKITLMERRPDLRKVTQDAGRSINLAFSNRGMKGIRMVGLNDEVKKLCIPMLGRMIHDAQGKTFLSPYSGREGEYINSISRPGLNSLLLDAAEACNEVTVVFNQKCISVDLENASAKFEDDNSGKVSTVQGDILIGTDGAGSVVRKAMFDHRQFLFSFSQQWLTHGYKELTIPAAVDGGFRTEKGALHIWPRGADMLIALPNLDGSFTVTLFAPYSDSDYCFDNLTTKEKVMDYFKSEFPDTLDLMPQLADEFFENPTAPLGTIKCSPWHAYGKTLIMGDAAHAIVPFYGQGMNASFEDVVEFDKVLDQNGENWNEIFKRFSTSRKVDTDAIADLAVDNFHEMKEHTANPLFQAKRRVETALEANFPGDYSSKYSLVTFSEQIPYSLAMRQGRAQDKAILNLLDDGLLPDDLELEEKLKRVKAHTKEILHEDELL